VAREGAAKIDKDVAQTAVLLDILAERRKADLRKAWAELRSRGPKWRRPVDEGLQSLPTETLASIAPVVAA